MLGKFSFVTIPEQMGVARQMFLPRARSLPFPPLYLSGTPCTIPVPFSSLTVFLNLHYFHQLIFASIKVLITTIKTYSSLLKQIDSSIFKNKHTLSLHGFRHERSSRQGDKEKDSKFKMFFFPLSWVKQS